jgi:hypothetical protein
MTFYRPPPRSRLPGYRILSRARLAIGLASMAGLMACGGSDGTSTPAPVVPPVAITTTLSGAVVKGPVAGAQVCAYSVAGSSRGAALGTCGTSDAGGNYSLSLAVASGAVWLEATGGSYTDEATAALTSLPAGVPLTSLVNTAGGSMTAMLTPLTTLALNTARSTVGASSTLDITAFNAGAAQVLSTFNLPASLNLSTTPPVFGASANDYATALVNISRMVAAGLPLTQILNTAQVSALQAAYASAAAGGGVTPAPTPTPTPNPVAGTASASGSVTVAGGRGDFTPQGDGFEVGVKADATTYHFYRKTPTQQGGGTVIFISEINVTVPRVGEPTVTYLDAAAGFTVNVCFSSCGVTVTSPAGATHPVTVSFAGTALSGGRTLDGSLTGDATDALWSPRDLPRTTDGLVAVNGGNVFVQTATDTTTAGAITQRSIALIMADGTVIAVGQINGGAPTVSRLVSAATSQFCLADCRITLTDSADGTAVKFDGTPLSDGVTLANTVFIGKTKGSANSPELGAFTPDTDKTTSLNDLREVRFSTPSTTSGPAGISSVTVEHRGSRVMSASVSTGSGATAHSCFEVAMAGRPACAGITVSANGRSISFQNTVLAGGAIGAPVANITLNGTLQAKGQ